MTKISWVLMIGCAGFAAYVLTLPPTDIVDAKQFCAGQPDYVRQACIDSVMHKPDAIPTDEFLSRP